MTLGDPQQDKRSWYDEAREMKIYKTRIDITKAQSKP
jgi:hypothetical protein